MKYIVKTSYVKAQNILDYAKNMAPPSWEKFFNDVENELIHIEKMCSKMRPYIPDPNKIFESFDLTDLNSIKVVILAPYPYCDETENTGLAYSLPVGKKANSTVQNIYKVLKKNYPEFEIPEHGDLRKWCRQGVFLYNLCCTTKINVKDSHGYIWAGFTNKLLNTITTVNPDCIFLLWGNQAFSLYNDLSQRTIKLCASEPYPENCRYATKYYPAFMDCDHFLKVNQNLEERGEYPINWAL